MPTIIFANHEEEEEWRCFAAVRILAWATWPDQPDKRRAFEVINGAEMTQHYADCATAWEPELRAAVLERHSEDELQRAVPDFLRSPAAWVREMAHQTFLEPAGGIRALVEAPSKDVLTEEFEERWLDVLAVGNILRLIASMHVHHRHELRGGAGHAKANHIFKQLVGTKENNQALRAAGRRSVNGTYLKDVWRTHRCAAALCAALTHVACAEFDDVSGVEAIYGDDGFNELIVYASWYQAFLKRFRPQVRRMPPLVGPRELIAIPNPLIVSDEIIDPLTPEELAAARTYAAPIPQFA